MTPLQPVPPDGLVLEIVCRLWQDTAAYKQDRTMRKEVIRLARQAGDEILKYYRKRDTYTIENKADESPVTCADLAANEILMKGLQRLTPDIPILSEEVHVPYEERKDWTTFWLVDPLDGTRCFINEEDTFAVNIALVKDNRPILGVLYAPVFDECFSAEEGQGAWLNGHRICNESRRKELIAAISYISTQGKTTSFLEKHGINNAVYVGSALKFGRLATGEVDLYPRFAASKEWDTAAGQAIIEEAGCKILEFHSGKPPEYNKKSLDQYPFVATRKDINLL